MDADRRKAALECAEQALSELEGGGPLAPVVMKCLRLTRLTDDAQAARWFRLELQGYKENVDAEWERYAPLSGREAPPPQKPATRAGADENPDTTSGRQVAYWWTLPIEEIEASTMEMREELRALTVPASLPETSPNYDPHVILPPRTDAEKVLGPIFSRRQAAALELRKWTHIIATLRGALQAWLSQQVVQLSFGTMMEDALDRARGRVDTLLRSHAPEVAKALSAAFERARSADPEEWSQSLTSCRRALKALADALYPPTDEKRHDLELTDEKYLNRLRAFVRERSAGSKRELLNMTLETVEKRAAKLNEIASKGVHAEVDEIELEVTIVQTYFLGGELLSVAEGDPESEADSLSSPTPADQELTSTAKSADNGAGASD